MEKKTSLDDTLALMRDLRARCEWDAAQTHESLRPYLIEESHELDDAIRQQDDPLMDLRGEPVEEPMARQGLLAQRRRLDLRVLDREAAHVVAVGSADLRGDGGSPTGTDRDGRALARSLPDAGQRRPGERYGALALGVNGQIRTGHAGMVTTDPHPSLICDPLGYAVSSGSSGRRDSA